MAARPPPRHVGGLALDRLLEPGAHWRHKIVATAVKLDLFTALDEGPHAAAAIARRYRGDTRAFEILLNALVALGLLRKRGGAYANSEAAGRYLVRGRAGYRGDQLVVDDLFWGLWGRLEETLMTGRSPLRQPLFRADPQAAERLALGLHRDALLIAPGLARRLPLQRHRRMLDLGGGAGTYAITFCRRHPRLQATVFELPAVARVARRIVAERGLEDRVRVVEGDFLADPIAGAYDLVFMSHVLHGNGPEENRALVRKVAGCLEPGGRIVVQDVLMDEGVTRPRYGAIFAVNILLHTGGGRCYSRREISGWLTEAGLTGIELIERNAVLTARKPES